MGILYLHGGYGSVGMSDAILQDQYGDTTYYLIPEPCHCSSGCSGAGCRAGTGRHPRSGHPVLVAGYNRTVSPGTPTKAQFTYFPNPVALGTNLAVAVPTGVDNGFRRDRHPAARYATAGPTALAARTSPLSPTTNEQPAASPLVSAAVSASPPRTGAAAHGQAETRRTQPDRPWPEVERAVTRPAPPKLTKPVAPRPPFGTWRPRSPSRLSRRRRRRATAAALRRTRVRRASGLGRFPQQVDIHDPAVPGAGLRAHLTMRAPTSPPCR